MTGGNTRSFGWETQNTPFNMAFVYGIIFSGNTITTTSACTQNLANYAVSLFHCLCPVESSCDVKAS